MSTKSWHEKWCGRADVFLSDNVPVCLSCGCTYTPTSNESQHRGELSATTPTVTSFSGRTKLELDWPATITFSSPEDIEDSDLRTALKWRQRIRVEPGFVEYLDHALDIKNSKGLKGLRDLTAHDGRLEKGWQEFSNTTSAEVNPSTDPTKLITSMDDRNNECPSQTQPQGPIYEPLTGQDEIRLLRISSSLSEESHVLHGTLITSHLSRRPEFTALSYTWADRSGDRSRRETIFLGTEWTPLPITANCAAALRRLRSRTDVRVVWVDAICIDQDNTGERSHQVGLMRDIYSRADRVVIFLGDDGPRQTLESELMNRMSEEYFYTGNAVNTTWSWERDAAAFKALFQRPYWSRMWVIQEVLLSKEAIVVLSGSSVPLSRILKGHFINDGLTQFFPSWTQLAGPSVDGDVDAFSQLLVKTSSCQALDQRDRVFALLGLVQGAHLEGLVADYTKTAEIVYTGVAAYFLIRHGQTNILKWATLSSGSHSFVPSWDLSPSGSTQIEDAFRVPRNQSWNNVKHLHSGSDKFDFHEPITPGHICRKSHMGNERVGDILNTLRPRVLKNSGALLLRAYPVLQLNWDTFKNAFSSDLEFGLFEDSFFLKPSTGLKSLDHTPEWAIYASRSSYRELGKWNTASFDFSEDWIVEVPNCDTFLHLQPDGIVPGIYRIASVCYLTLVTGIDTQLLTCMEGREKLPFDDHLLLLRLLMFEPHQLLFLQSWETIMERNGSLLQPEDTARITLSALHLVQYSRWFRHIELYPKSTTGPTTDGASSVFDGALTAVSSYLDGWSDVDVWDCITKALTSIEWSTYANRFDELRKSSQLDVTATRLSIQQEKEIYHSRLLRTHFRSRGEMWGVVSEGIRQLLQELLDDVMSAVDKLDLPGLSGKAMYLGSYRLSETAQRLCKVIDDTASWDVEELRAKQDEIFQEWTEFGSYLRDLQWSSTEYEAIRNKFIQRQVLRSLYTRCGLREFLIF